MEQNLDITNKSPQSLGTLLDQGSTVNTDHINFFCLFTKDEEDEGDNQQENGEVC